MTDSPTYCYFYRLPGQREVIGGCSDRKFQSAEGKGFLISSFKSESNIFIPCDSDCELSDVQAVMDRNQGNSIYRFPQVSTEREDHRREVCDIVECEKQGLVRKVVAARCRVCEGKVDIAETFRELCRRYPDAFVFLFSTPDSGTWMGATPETLLIRNGNQIESMALAGTRRAGTVGPWDEKNRKEQQVVTEHITSVFRECGLEPQTEGPVTRQAGDIEHQMTVVKAKIDDEYGSNAFKILAHRLSPTPAVCGMPTTEAMAVIETNEGFERAYFGGFCGPCEADGDFRLYVNLLSGWFEPDRFCLMAGGGIMSESNPEAEWEETERKMDTLLKAIKQNPNPNI